MPKKPAKPTRQKKSAHNPTPAIYLSRPAFSEAHSKQPAKISKAVENLPIKKVQAISRYTLSLPKHLPGREVKLSLWKPVKQGMNLARPALADKPLPSQHAPWWSELLIINLAELVTWPFVVLFKKQNRARVREVWSKQKQIQREPWHLTLKIPLRPLVSFALLAFIFILPFQIFASVDSWQKNFTKAISNQANSGLTSLQTGWQAIQSGQSGTMYFLSARESFAQSVSQIQDFQNSFLGNLTSIIPPLANKINSGHTVFLAAQRVSEAASSFSFVLNKNNQSNLLSALNQPELMEALNSLEESLKLLENVDASSLPAKDQIIISSLKNEGDRWLSLISDIKAVSILTRDLSGQNGFRRYLLVFQNSTEQRPSGGFLGSYAVMDVDKTGLRALTVPGGGFYDLKAGFTKRQITPAPMRILGKYWAIWDANWSPDWKTSAENIRQFYTDAGGSSIDGIISFTPTILEKLLAITGPVALENRSLILEPENVISELQNIVESSNERLTRQPKKVIGELIDVLQKKLADPAPYAPQLAQLLFQSLSERHILSYFVDPASEQLAEAHHWAGRLEIKPDQDYLAVIGANLGSAKTDRYIKQTIDQTATIQGDGSVVDEVTLTRKHEGLKGDPLYGAHHTSYIRFYVPKGSVLLSYSGFNPPPAALFLRDDATDVSVYQDPMAALSAPYVGTEGEATVFGGWLQVKPGETTQIKIRYKLPMVLAENTSVYQITSQPQSGQYNPSDYKFNLTLNAPYSAKWWQGSTDINTTDNNLSFDTNLTTDSALGVIIQKN